MHRETINVHALDIRELGDAADDAGVMPSELLSGRGLLYVASTPER